jgi:ribosome recycling factor
MAYDFSDFKSRAKAVEEWLLKECSAIRTGRATITLLDSVFVESYGVRTPLNQTASLSVEDPRTIRIVPWDKSIIPAIEKGITLADLGVSTGSDGEGVRVKFPELTTENRQHLVKLAHKKLEEAKISLRGERGDTVKDIEAKQKAGELPEDDARRHKEELQKMVDATQAALDLIIAAKEKEILN